MTTLEAKKIVEEVLQGLWPRWSPNTYEVTSWVNKLRTYHYEKAEKAINTMFYEIEKRSIEPPAGRIVARLKAEAVEFQPTDDFKKEPGKLYGKEARDKAFADILNGPDTKTRRWLMKYLEEKYPETKKQDVCKVGEVISEGGIL